LLGLYLEILGSLEPDLRVLPGLSSLESHLARRESLSPVEKELLGPGVGDEEVVLHGKSHSRGS